MFGSPFGQPSPVSQKENLSNEAEIVNILTELGFIRNSAGLLPEDVKAIQSRMEVITQKHGAMSEEALTSLAYVDRMLTVNTLGSGELLASISGDLVSPLVKDPSLANDTEFLSTVVALAKKNFDQGVAPFSEALLSALATRQSQIKSTPEVDGVIDGQDNVIINNEDRNLH